MTKEIKILPLFASKNPLIFIVGLLTVALGGCQIEQSPAKITSKHAVAYAKENLPQTGILRQKNDGYIYLKIDDAYVTELFPIVREPRCLLPNVFYRERSIGAHVSVIYANEAHRLGRIKEIGQTFTFKPKRIKKIRTHKFENVILEIDAPELARLRKSYGLPPKLKGHEFHITLCQKRL